jgi:hypothetical protein
LVKGSGKDPITAISDVVDKFIETPDEKREWKLILAKMAQEPALVQVELNKIEAGHRTMFVAGWRPFIGWTCGVALAYNYIVRDLIGWVILNLNIEATIPPALQMEHLLTILLGMLGLGGLRTIEKLQGKTK